MSIDVTMTQSAKNPQIAMAVIVLHTIDVVGVQTLLFIRHIYPAIRARPIVFFPKFPRYFRKVFGVAATFCILGESLREMFHNGKVAVVFL